MTLKIKDLKDNDVEIELRRDPVGVDVWIHDEFMGKFYDDGRFVFHGPCDTNRYTGRWDK